MPPDGDVDFLRVCASSINLFERLSARLGLTNLDPGKEADRITFYCAFARRMDAATNTLRLADVRSMNHLAVFVMKVEAAVTEEEVRERILGNVCAAIADKYVVAGVTEASVFAELWTELKTLTNADVDFTSASRMAAMNPIKTVCAIFASAFVELSAIPELSVDMSGVEAGAETVAFSAAPTGATAPVQGAFHPPPARRARR